MSPTKNSMITPSVHKTTSTGLPSIFKVCLKYNSKWILAMYYSLDLIYDSSTTEVEDKSLGTLTDDVTKYCKLSTLISSSAKKLLETLLLSWVLSLTISCKGDEISIAEGKMLCTLMPKLIAIEFQIIVTCYIFDKNSATKFSSKSESKVGSKISIVKIGLSLSSPTSSSKVPTVTSEYKSVSTNSLLSKAFSFESNDSN